VRVNCRISDLYVDMRDGRNLIKLLEILSGERLPRPTKGKMRIHCLENVDKALQFLRDQRVHLENIGSHDIVDGNSSLNLGLIWTIILRFQVSLHVLVALCGFKLNPRFHFRFKTLQLKKPTTKKPNPPRMRSYCGVR